MHRTLVRVACTAFVALSVVSCKDYGPSDPGPVLRVDPVWATVEPGETRQLSVTLDGSPTDVAWESSDPAVASVNASGLVTGLTPGYTAVTATSAANPSLLISSSITVPVLQGTALTSGTALAVTGATGSNNLYRIRVNAGATQLRVAVTNGTGDGDLYVRYGIVPPNGANAGGTAATGCRPFLAGTNESCTFANPASGSWYIRINGYEAYTGTLTATVTY